MTTHEMDTATKRTSHNLFSTYCSCTRQRPICSEFAVALGHERRALPSTLLTGRLKIPSTRVSTRFWQRGTRDDKERVVGARVASDWTTVRTSDCKGSQALGYITYPANASPPRPPLRTLPSTLILITSRPDILVRLRPLAMRAPIRRIRIRPPHHLRRHALLHPPHH